MIREKLDTIKKFRAEAPKSGRQFARENGIAENNLRRWLKQEEAFKREIELKILQVSIFYWTGHTILQFVYLREF